ncbi:MAG: hypothetical protein JW840_03455 [Candidatus Thermoplasmatota archaeon]|nr:hypothetical protein [Candidatus Thermoplasmatota archaeon]
MKRKCVVFGISLCAVVLLVLGSFTSCLRVETVQGCDCGNPPCWVELSGAMGNNNWYVSDVHVGFNGSFNQICYRLNGGSWQTYTAPFTITIEGIILFEWKCDYNSSDIYSIEIKIDKTPPLVSVNYTWERIYWKGYIYIYSVEAFDTTSGMNRTEFFINGVLQEYIFGPGPHYEYTYPLYFTDRYNVKGLIRNREITDDYVKFDSIIVFVYVVSNHPPNFTQRFYAYDNAGLSSYVDILNPIRPASIKPGLYLFQNLILPNNYTGYVGRYLVKATFFGDIEVN